MKILNVIDNVNLIKKDIITICNEESADIYRYTTPFDPHTIDFLYDKGAEFFRNRMKIYPITRGRRFTNHWFFADDNKKTQLAYLFTSI